MKRVSGYSSYLKTDNTEQNQITVAKKSPVGIIVSLIFSALVIVMALQTAGVGLAPTNTPKEENASAFSGFMCRTIGSGMKSPGDWETFMKEPPNPENPASGGTRDWTLQEAVGSNLTYVNYYGEGGDGEDDEAGFPLADVGDRSKGTPAEGIDGLKEARGFGSCAFGTMGTTVASGVLGFSGAISNLTQSIAVFAFDTKFICRDVDDTGCINLLKIIGGDGSSEDGIIGVLTSSIYLPLLVFAVAIVAMWILYTGIIKRAFREAFFGLVWMLVAVILGLAFLYNPQLVAKAPMAITNSVGACVIGAFNGENCFTESSSSGEIETDGSKTVCKSQASDLPTDEQMSMAVNGLSCQIWKAFILEPYALGSFGTNFDNLYLDGEKKNEDLVEIVEGIEGVDVDDFKFSLQSSESPDSMKGKTLDLDGSGEEINNLAAYQLFVMTDAKSGDNKFDKAGEGTDAYDKRWYNIIAVVAEDDNMWNTWTSTGGGFFQKASIALISAAATIGGGIVIVVISFFALLYYLISIIMMVLAPLFLLLAVHPGRGRKMFLGWLSQVTSNVLKYLASALFLIVTISLYGAAMANSDNIALTFVFVLILTGALLLYRGEIVNMIGKADMGGEKLSNAFGDKVREKAQSGVRFGSSVLGGAVGGAAASGLRGNPVSGAWSGLRESANRELKRKNNFAGNVARQRERSGNVNKKDFNTKAQNAQTDANTASENFNNTNDRYTKAAAEVDNMRESYDRDSKQYDDLKDRANTRSEVENKVLIEMSADNPDYAKAKGLENDRRDVSTQRRSAEAAGQTETADRLAARENVLDREAKKAMEDVSYADRQRGERRYKTMTKKGMASEGVEFTEEDQANFDAINERLSSTRAKFNEKVNVANALADSRDEAEAEYLGQQAYADKLSETSEKINKSGSPAKASQIDKSEKLAKHAAEEARGNAVPTDRFNNDLTPRHKQEQKPNDKGNNGGNSGNNDDRQPPPDNNHNNDDHSDRTQPPPDSDKKNTDDHTDRTQPPPDKGRGGGKPDRGTNGKNSSSDKDEYSNPFGGNDRNDKGGYGPPDDPDPSDDGGDDEDPKGPEPWDINN